LATNPKDRPAALLLGLAWQQTGELAKAESVFAGVHAPYFLARVQFLRGRFDEALASTTIALAAGETKAGAYRAAYDTHSKPAIQSLEGQRLAAHPSIALQVEALRLAAEAKQYATPPALRALVLERLTAHAIDPDIKPAQRLRALELLGKVTEIAAFTERRELVKVTDSGQARTKLIQTLRDAMRAGAVDVDILGKTDQDIELDTIDAEPNADTEPVELDNIVTSELNDLEPGPADPAPL
jgi:hypothetical protein